MRQQPSEGKCRIIRLVKTIGRQLIPNLGTLLIVSILLWAQQAGALSLPQSVVPNALPVEITYQGNLTDTSGDPVTADVDMTFTLYDTLTGGTVLWSEAYTGGNAVSVQDGEFTVHLGSKAPFPDDIWENDLLYLGIKVGTEPEMTPREMITAVPRAVQASVALTVPDGSITSEKQTVITYRAQHNDFVSLEGQSTVTISEFQFDNVPSGDVTVVLTLVAYHMEGASSGGSLSLESPLGRVDRIPTHVFTTHCGQVTLQGNIENFSGGTLILTVSATGEDTNTQLRFGAWNGDSRFGRKITVTAGQ